jgi:hypothetical protein
MSNADFISVIYKNVLGRTSVDADGMAYWSASLATGTATRASLINNILGAAHGLKGDAAQGQVADLLDNKLAVAHYFAIDLGLNFNTNEASILQGMAIAAAVTSTSTAAAIALIGVSDLPLLPT